MLTKYASLEASEVLEIKGSSEHRTSSLEHLAEFDNYRTEDRYLYARIRAISSRVNRNNDGWPSVELAGSPEIFSQHTASEGGFTVEAKRGENYGFSTFLGKPVFVDHNNSNPSRARGVIVDAKLHVEDQRIAASLDPYYASAPENHTPPTWVELLLEVDAKSFPKLAKAIIDGAKDGKSGIDGFSMGANVEKSVCSICKNAATNPDEYCKHVRLKGATFDSFDDVGKKTSKKCWEDCYGVQFFEISAVFDPADETALIREVRSSVQKEGSIHLAENPLPQSMMDTAPEHVDTLREEEVCPVCFVPGTLIRTEHGYVPIETIEPGDRVLTSSGFHPVKEVIENEFNGILKEIHSKTCIEPIRVTPDHPFMTLLNDKDHRCQPGTCDRAKSFDKTHRLGWSHASHLDKRNYLILNSLAKGEDLEKIEIPIEYRGKRVRNGPTEFELSSEFLWAVGLYLAEGNSGARELTYSLHRDEVEYQDRLKNFWESHGYTTRLTLRESKPNSAWVNVHSSSLAEWFPVWLGEGCAHKKIPAELLNLPNEKLGHLIRGVLDGDGCYAFDTFKQTSPILALQVLEASLRTPGKWATVSQEAIPGKKIAYCLQNAEGTSIRTPSDGRRIFRYGTGKWEFEGRKLQRIKDVKDYPYWGKVYNLSVENDPTYTVQNILVHNCGSSYSEGDQCEVCGYVPPPEGMDNPDLEKAKENVQKNMLQEDGPHVNGAPNDLEQAQTPPPAQVNAPTNNNPPSPGVTSGWQMYHPKLAGKINPVERPIRPGNPPVTNEPNETIIADQTRPVTSRTAASMIAAVNQGDQMSNWKFADAASGAPESAMPDKRVDVTGVGGVLEGSNEEASKADGQVDVEGIGSTGVDSVAADATESIEKSAEPGSDDAGFNKDKTTDDSGPTKTFGDSDGEMGAFTDPVTNKPFPDRSEGVKKSHDDSAFPAEDGGIAGGKAVEGVEPSDPVGKAMERVDVLDHVTSPSNNSGPTKTWSGTDGNGVLKQQPPVTKDVVEYNTENAWTSHVVAALKVAELEVSMGITPASEKYNRIETLSHQHPELVSQQFETLSKVRQAGLRKGASVADGGISRLPSFRQAKTASIEPTNVDESLFW